MKLHNLVDDPTKLKTYGKYILLEDAYQRLESGDKDPRLINVVANDPWRAFRYARDVIKGRFPEGEKAIARYKFAWEEYEQFLKSKGIEIPQIQSN